jgi:chitodextrinase
MRRLVLIAVTALASLVGASAAQAVVVDINPAAAGQPSMAYNAASLNDYAGVALVPGTGTTLAAAGVPTVTSTVSPCDPYLSSDLTLLPAIGICSHGGPVIHANEVFALTWDPNRWYGELTRGYVEQFLKDVADGSGTLTSPYAVTTQYQDAGGRAGNVSTYGGACIDYGNPGGYTCQFGNTTGIGTGNQYPTSACPAGSISPCLTDADIQAELTTHLANTGLLGHVALGDTPLLVVLLPPGVEVCLNSVESLCSANVSATAQFCSYHSQVNYGGTEVPYVVQPFTAGTGCDEPKLPGLPANPTDQDVATYNGTRLVSPLSAAEIAAIVNPDMNGWFAESGSEINDNYGCVPEGVPFDSATVGTSGQNPYFLQREFNNAGVIDTDPSVMACAPSVSLAPNFIVPSSVEPGDVVQFDGSITQSMLIVPAANYQWNYGDGTTAIGPSVEHSYAKGGTYTVTLTVTDRGGNVATLSQTISVLGASGQPPAPPKPVSPPAPGSTALLAHLQLMPQGLKGLLRNGISVRVTSNQAAAGFVTLTIPRSAARQAHIKTGRGASVVVGRGTVSGIASGTASLRVHLSRTMAKKLGHLRHVTLTVRLTLADAAGGHVAVDAAGRYAK